MKDINQIKKAKRALRHNRVRSKVSGTAQRPRLSVFRANDHIYAQLIDDSAGKTLAAASSLEIKAKDKKASIAAEVGKIIANKAKEINISSVVFDRGGFAYHGRVKALADGAREGGLKF
jgi:large subunit ribosomal protein L18